MLESFRIWIGSWLFKPELDGILKMQRELDEHVNQRVASIVAHMDPLEPLMKSVHCIFGEEWEHPESKLDAQSKLQMQMWAYSQAHDPCFKFLTDWIMNTQGNAMLKAPARNNEERGEVLLFGKAQIASVMLCKREIGRLSRSYEELLEKDKDMKINSESTVE